MLNLFLGRELSRLCVRFMISSVCEFELIYIKFKSHDKSSIFYSEPYLTTPSHSIFYHPILSFTISFHLLPSHAIPFHLICSISYHLILSQTSNNIPNNYIQSHTIPFHTISYHLRPSPTIPKHLIPYHKI